MSQFIEDTEVGKKRTFLVKFREFGKPEAKSEYSERRTGKLLFALCMSSSERNATRLTFSTLGSYDDDRDRGCRKSSEGAAASHRAMPTVWRTCCGGGMVGRQLQVCHRSQLLPEGRAENLEGDEHRAAAIVPHARTGRSLYEGLRIDD